jgi:hypothetical protein
LHCLLRASYIIIGISRDFRTATNHN